MVILCVDDDERVRLLLLKLLKADGLTVLSAEDGKSALEVSRNHTGPIDLLLSDVKMPGMNGLELCEIVAAERPDTKVLLMSGDLASREHIDMSGVPCLQKPFTVTSLWLSVESLLGRIQGRLDPAAPGESETPG